MQRKAGNRRREPIRYVVEHVYSGKESMEKVLTAVSEEAAKQNVKEKLENQKKHVGNLSEEVKKYLPLAWCLDLSL